MDAEGFIGRPKNAIFFSRRTEKEVIFVCLGYQRLKARRIHHSQSREPQEIKKLRKRPLIKTKFFVLSKHYNPCLC
jgi:hypothetical protein